MELHASAPIGLRAAAARGRLVVGRRARRPAEENQAGKGDDASDADADDLLPAECASADAESLGQATEERHRNPDCDARDA